MEKELHESISSLLGVAISESTPISGGDISSAYLLKTPSDRLFCKINTQPGAQHMFEAEKAGLETIAAADIINTPEIYVCSPMDQGACIIMEYLEPGRADNKSMSVLGEQLASLHGKKNKFFGLKQNNYIGSLCQSNQKHDSWTMFYIQERLLPQLEIAMGKGLLLASEVPSVRLLWDVLETLFEGAEASLLHGDLWGGNFLISSAGTPYLIDPAIYYGHSEVDIAMTKLFGGFGNSFYSAYEKIIPSGRFTNDRIKIYQLYYLLVHLNLFGTSYKPGVITILKSYFY